VSEREDLVDHRLADPVVDALVATAQEGEMRVGSEALRGPLVEARRRGCDQDSRRAGTTDLDRLDRTRDRFGLDDHPRATAERRVVDGAVVALGEGSRIRRRDLDQPALERLAEQPAADETFDQ